MAEERAQRRLAAILAADVVGYSRLMGQVLEPLVAKYEGRIFKIAGDGVLAELASGVNAVACVVKLQQQMAVANDGVFRDRRIALRVCGGENSPRSPRHRARIQDFRRRQQKKSVESAIPTSSAPRFVGSFSGFCSNEQKQNRLHPCARYCVNLQCYNAP
jgi:hypothetical protein